MTAARFAPRARRDLLAAARWIAKENPRAAQALRETVAAATDRIGKHPDIGVIRSELVDAPYRFLFLTGFPYVVVYNSTSLPPLILRILHGARDLPELLKDLSA
jgi:toxin ParE1/3/4